MIDICIDRRVLKFKQRTKNNKDPFFAFPHHVGRIHSSTLVEPAGPSYTHNQASNKSSPVCKAMELLN